MRKFTAQQKKDACDFMAWTIEHSAFQSAQTPETLFDLYSNQASPDPKKKPILKVLIDLFEEELEIEDGNLLDAMAEELDDIVRDIFEMDSWDEPADWDKYLEYEGNVYKIDIKDVGCIEATHSHRIIDWEVSVTLFGSLEELKEKYRIKRVTL